MVRLKTGCAHRSDFWLRAPMHGGDMSDQSNIRPGSACPSEVTDASVALAGAQSEHAAIVLAGGDGTRLSEFTREMFGEEIPKQFCKFWGEHTLLEQTRRRAGLFIDPARTITVLTASHARFYRPLLEGLGQGHLAIQPEKRGTAPAILYALMRLKKLAPKCSVAMFPSDHFVDDDRRFMRHVEAALRAVDDRPEQTILLGIEPTEPDAQYGWIEPGELVANECEPIRQIRRFWEKPPLPIARRLMNSGWMPVEQLRYRFAAVHFSGPLPVRDARAVRSLPRYRRGVGHSLGNVSGTPALSGHRRFEFFRRGTGQVPA
jgi:hypothetical protein